MNELYPSFPISNNLPLSNALLFNVIENLQEAFCLIEAIRDEKNEITDFKCLYVNKAGARDNYITPEEMTGRRLSEFLPALYHSRLFDVYRNSIIHNQFFSLESEFIEENCDERPVRGFFDLKGTPMGDQLCLTWQNVTEYKSLAEEYRELASKLKLDHDKLTALFEHLPVGIGITDKNGRITSFNSYGLQVHGFNVSDEKLIVVPQFEDYKNFFEVRSFNGDIIPPEDWPVSRALRGEYVNNFEAITINKITNIEKIISYTVVPLKDKAGCIKEYIYLVRDITEQKNQEETLRKNEELLQVIIDTVPAMISIYEEDMQHIKVNKAVERITGWTKEDYTKKNILELSYPDQHYRQYIIDYMKSLKPGFMDQKMTAKSGELIDTSWANVKIPDGRIVGIGIDISGRKSMEQKLVKAMLELERSNKDLEQFAYAASHDLQSPLNQIRNFAQLFERKFRNKVDGDAEEYLNFIESAVLRMSRLIQGLLEFSRITSNARIEKVNTNDIVSNALLNIELFIKENNASVDFGDLCNVKGDPVLLTQLFQNLIQNAVKFHSAAPPQVKIFSEGQDGEILFKIADNGIGIEAEYFQRIFIIFQRLHDERTYNGTGIGLAVCKRIVEHHHGRIWVESELNKGTTFFFTLPGG